MTDVDIINDPHHQRGGLGWALGVALAVETLSSVQRGKAPSIEVLSEGARDDVRLALIIVANAYTHAP